MDILDLAEELKNLRLNGHTFHLEERVQLEMALMKLQAESPLEEVLFWGKIQALQNDYYIALGLNYKGHYEFPQKQFFWAVGGEIIFKPFPELND